MIAGMVISPVIVGTTWRLLYSPDFGLINYFLGVIGLGRHAFLAQGNTVIPALVVTDVWQRSPLIMVIVLAAIQGLPTDEYEASKIDGASSFQSFIHITIPLLKPALLLSLLIRIMDCFRTFDTIYAMTGGGPGTESQNLNILMYNTGFQFFQISKVTAMAVISLIIITVISMLLVKAIRTDSAVL
jgi:multiple sugar transport system permease protein